MELEGYTYDTLAHISQRTGKDVDQVYWKKFKGLAEEAKEREKRKSDEFNRGFEGCLDKFRAIKIS